MKFLSKSTNLIITPNPDLVVYFTNGEFDTDSQEIIKALKETTAFLNHEIVVAEEEKKPSAGKRA